MLNEEEVVSNNDDMYSSRRSMVTHADILLLEDSTTVYSDITNEDNYEDNYDDLLLSLFENDDDELIVFEEEEEEDSFLFQKEEDEDDEWIVFEKEDEDTLFVFEENDEDTLFLFNDEEEEEDQSFPNDDDDEVCAQEYYSELCSIDVSSWSEVLSSHIASETSDNNNAVHCRSIPIDEFLTSPDPVRRADRIKLAKHNREMTKKFHHRSPSTTTTENITKVHKTSNLNNPNSKDNSQLLKHAASNDRTPSVASTEPCTSGSCDISTSSDVVDIEEQSIPMKEQPTRGTRVPVSYRIWDIHRTIFKAEKGNSQTNHHRKGRNQKSKQKEGAVVPPSYRKWRQVLQFQQQLEVVEG